jgi:hypothetical protein
MDFIEFPMQLIARASRAPNDRMKRPPIDAYWSGFFTSTEI